MVTRVYIGWNWRRSVAALVFATLLVLLVPMWPQGTYVANIGAPSLHVPNFGSLPLIFVPGAGSDSASVSYIAYAAGGSFHFSSSRVELALSEPAASAKEAQTLTLPMDLSQSGKRSAAPVLLQLQFVGADPTTDIVNGNPLPGKVNDLRGRDSTKWRTGVPTYAGITYRGLYPGIDLDYSGSNQYLKGTYSVAAGADPSRIKWRYAECGARWQSSSLTPRATPMPFLPPGRLSPMCLLVLRSGCSLSAYTSMG